MTVDTYMAKGSTHSVCQDYCLNSNQVPENFRIPEMVVVSDGCSSSPHTDIGARMLCLASAQELASKNIPSPLKIIKSAKLPKPFNTETLNPWSDILGEKDRANSTDATLLLAWRTLEGVEVQASGDGVIVARRRDGSTEVHVMSYKDSTPGYLSYLLDNERAETYLSRGHGHRAIEKYILQGEELISQEIREVRASLVNNMPNGWTETFRFSYLEYDLVAVMSDGVETFYDKAGRRSVPLGEVLNKLLCFKKYDGLFLQRRLNRFAKQCVSKQWVHEDDFSMGCIYMGELSSSESLACGEE